VLRSLTRDPASEAKKIRERTITGERVRSARRRLAGLAAGASLVLGATVTAAGPSGEAPTGAPGFDAFRAERVELRQRTQRIKAKKCRRPVHPFRRWARQVPASGRDRNLAHWRRHVAWARDLRSHCIPEWPWLALAECESGGRWAYNGPSGFDGGLQFLPSTWVAAGGRARGYPYAWQAPPWVQVDVARSWLAKTSWDQWPVCSRVIGAQ
jgi:Transglycosylase-like domain